MLELGSNLTYDELDLLLIAYSQHSGTAKCGIAMI